MARVRERSGSGALSWSAAPGWIRATAAAALVAGTALGIGVGRSWPAGGGNGDPGGEPAQTFLSATAENSLADSYWSLMEDAADAEPEAMP
jgi:hypothetical protein